MAGITVENTPLESAYVNQWVLKVTSWGECGVVVITLKSDWETLIVQISTLV